MCVTTEELQNHRDAERQARSDMGETERDPVYLLNSICAGGKPPSGEGRDKSRQLRHAPPS